MRGGNHTGEASYQFTTAGSDIDLATNRPGYGTDPDTDDVNKIYPREYVITSGTGDLVFNHIKGHTETWEISSTPFIIRMGNYVSIDSTSTSTIKGNAVY